MSNISAGVLQRYAIGKQDWDAYRFGDFELATERYELKRNGVVQHVEPLVFDLILFLSRHPGRVVSRDEIVDGVWQGRLVSEATIDGCIKSARRILGDSGESQNYIRTVRGKGIRIRRASYNSG